MSEAATTGIRFERRGHAGVVTLARPQALNAVTHAMVRALAEQLDAWEADDAVRHVVIRAEGRAFSVGGDIRHLHEQRDNPDIAFFRDEYRLNSRIHHFPKPFVALVHGLVMGGGVGVSLHGSHVVAGPDMAFAMPEVGIGFFPDVGATHLLNRLPEPLGMELGLTGRRLDADACLAVGVATHRADDLDAVLERLTRMDVDGALGGLARSGTVPDAEPAFAAPSVQAIMDEAPPATVETLRAKSPTSLLVAHRQLREGRGVGFDDAMRLEFRIVSRILHGHDFYEGIRAQVIDKDRAPRWRPARVEDVDPYAVAAHFEPLERELDLADAP